MTPADWAVVAIFAAVALALAIAARTARAPVETLNPGSSVAADKGAES